MSKLSERKTKLKAETSARYRGRPLIFTADQFGVILREKGRRTAFQVDWQVIYEVGMKLASREVARLKAERKRGAR